MIDTDEGRHEAHASHALTISGDLTQHIASMRGTHVRSKQPRVQTTKEPPTPVNVNAVDDLDDLYMTLTYWCGVFAKALGEKPQPPLGGSRRLPDGTVIGFPHDVDPWIARAAVIRLTRGPLARLDEIPAHELAEFDIDARRIIDMLHRWPMEDDAERAEIPCPHHEGRVAMLVYPPTQHPRRAGAAPDLEVGRRLLPGDRIQDRVIVCDHGHYFTEAEFARVSIAYGASLKDRLKQARRDQADRERGKNVVLHLMETYKR